ncbi:MAG TPA: MiaB/RimO family radical SAM methylthiotransferase [Anaerolineaceae bacterium]|nr:MiaB/RimO family radical SAM methylthiotransferase [Anaerolineaceae bacterium]HOG79253.1 MiaB/RimO family radical SAM methylthiotransferase [Anaerolineaceae bacterium]HQN43301.1 MiaB/RimO family radical SAM methylthiotransferase [Anaerolineaceae bacterium]
MKIYLDWVGCRLNESEIERMAAQFAAAGHTLVDNPAEADRVVINTCAVTGEAASDSRGKIRQAARAGSAEIAVTGCWATLDPAAAAALPGVQWAVTNTDKDNLVAEVLGLEPAEFDLQPLERQPLPGARFRTRAFIKAQDGCDNFCTFCITRLLRGPGRSQPLESVLSDVHAARRSGAQELVLTGVHLGSWGRELNPPQTLANLIAQVLAATDAPRLRLSSVEPWDLGPDFWQLWQNPRLCRHLHLPLQSGCAATLRRMVRKVTPASFSDLVQSARAVAPEIAITTDVIVGFPGETEAEFTESLAFIQEIQFAGGHVFTFSPRPGTPAERLPGLPPMEVRKQRNARLRAVFAAAAESYHRQFMGQVLPVLWESTDSLGPQGWRLHGLTDNNLRVTALSPQRLWNQITPVRLEALTPDGLSGVIL